MTDPIKRRADGSIDTGHYMARGRQLRSDAAHNIARRAAPDAPDHRASPRFVWLLLAVGLVGSVLPFAV